MPLRLAAALVAAVLVFGATASAAGDGTAALTLSTKKSHAQTSLHVVGTFAPDATGQQRVLTAITLVMPVGTKLNSKAVTLCPGDGNTIADDPEGAKHACPADSQLGSGTAHVLLGTTDTTFDITAWNQAPGPTLELSVNGTPAYVVDSTVKANVVRFPLGLAEQLQAKTISFELTFDKLGTAKKPYVRTPSSCPKGKWKGSLQADVSGGGKLKIPMSTPCKKPKKKRS